jgi:hypothetical protein
MADCTKPSRRMPISPRAALWGMALRVLGALEDRARLGEEDSTGRGQPEASPGSAEQLDAELAFQCGDLPTQRGLRKVEAPCCPADVHVLSHSNERTQLLQLHIAELCSTRINFVNILHWTYQTLQAYRTKSWINDFSAAPGSRFPSCAWAR